MDRRNGQSELLLRGIATYARPGRPWVFSWESPSADGIQRLLELDLAGILAKDLDDRGVELIENSQVPAVHMGRTLCFCPLAAGHGHAVRQFGHLT